LVQSVITRKIAVAGGVFAPGHLGELTQILDADVDVAGVRRVLDQMVRARLANRE
jgi:hypothetical protein